MRDGAWAEKKDAGATLREGRDTPGGVEAQGKTGQKKTAFCPAHGRWPGGTHALREADGGGNGALHRGSTTPYPMAGTPQGRCFPVYKKRRRPWRSLHGAPAKELSFARPERPREIVEKTRG